MPRTSLTKTTALGAYGTYSAAAATDVLDSRWNTSPTIATNFSNGIRPSSTGKQSSKLIGRCDGKCKSNPSRKHLQPSTS